ncbi:hypothetical protein ACFVYT_24750 [Streptomyces sp. NPDC058290]|uniref:hypothetical protein n=1 Tax=Streptomyces sp. NPDC058290 TaxID=3346426 RepID=UPI0036E9A8CF
MADIDVHMHDLTAAAHALITDWSDVQVRGCLKEHPDIVDYRLAMVEKALREIRTKVEAERAANLWGGRVLDPETDFNTAAMDYAEHSCNCEWCLCCEPAGVGDEPIVWTVDPRPGA